MPWRSHLRASFMTSHGVVCSRSCSAATGRMTSRRELAAVALPLDLLVGKPEVHSLPSRKAPCGRSFRLTDQSTNGSIPHRRRPPGQSLWCAAVLRSPVHAPLLATLLIAVAAAAATGCSLGEASGDDGRPPQLER